MQLPDLLTRTPEGEIQLAGHRIGLFHLVNSYREGESAEMLASRYPTLPLALVHRVIAFYLENQADVDAYMTDCSAALEEQRNKSKHFDLASLRERLAKLHPSPTAANP